MLVLVTLVTKGEQRTHLRRSAGVVDPELLDAQEILAVRDALWDVGRVRVCGKLACAEEN